ncbi:hypothetical protein ACKBF6_002220 [Vibrio cholerae]|uniref:hypothetical protein n=1 Tax=Vibrio cholerae TaxID=666 RepID=UPI001EB1BB74|nr:hypothetical protein [Vibrio cholerae]EGQ7944379.1 hypothetical protein [Vibrio cholerae]MDV2397106.1 hypothetical protein [Vibrio cholerae]
MNKFYSRASYDFLFKIMILWLGVDVVLSVIRLAASFLSLNQDMFGFFSNLVTMFFFFAAILIYLLERKVMYIDLTIVCILLFLIILAGFTGLYNYGVTDASVKHLYMVFFAIGFILFGRGLSFFLANLERFYSIIIVVFFLNVLAVILFLVFSSVMPIYPGYGTQALGYVFFYFLSTNRVFLAFISFLLLVSQGKRSIMIAAILTFLISKLISRRCVGISLVSSIFVGVAVLFLFLYIIEYFNLYSLPGLDRMLYINPLNGSFDLALGSSGRFDEVVGALASFSENILNWFIGAGFGFHYQWQLTYGDFYSEVKSYMHNVPLMVIALFGVPIFMTFYSFIIYIFIRIRKLLARVSDPDLYQLVNFFSLSLLFFVLCSFFSLNSLSDPLGWVFLGACLGVIQKQKIQNLNNNQSQILK